MERGDFWMLMYLLAVNKDKLNPAYEAELALQYYDMWVEDSWEGEDED